MPDYKIRLPRPHAKQVEFIESTAKRKVIRAGRRGGKTVGAAVLAVTAFLRGRRVLYGAPTQEQIDRFWTEVTRALDEPINAGVFYKNETKHIISLPSAKTIIETADGDSVPGEETRIRAKTAWNAETLRGDYADLLILDEWQNQDESAWDEVGAPMLLDNDGDAVFIYTPPSLHSRSANKARDPQHAAKLFKKAQADKSGRWAAFHFSSHNNPYISKTALSEITKDMTALAIRQEIGAEDVDEAAGALWTRNIIELGRVLKSPESLARIVVAIDPSATSTGDDAGIVTAGSIKNDFYPIADDTIQGSPLTWGSAAIAAYFKYGADCIVAESNNGGEMVSTVIQQIAKEMKTKDPFMQDVRVKLVHASRGKATRAEPISAIYEQGRGHHVGSFPMLEDEMCLWIPGDPSPNRMDALVWAGTELMQRNTLSINPQATVGNYLNSQTAPAANPLRRTTF